ncbi:probable aminopeptidase [Chlamydia trachomatis]|nr:probable aminopeptidase [Chlamydia trachomatis]
MACEEMPDAVIDVATLTGAQMRALGMRISAIMGSDAVRDDLIEAAAIAGEPAWPMPLPEYLEKNLNSPIADMQNTGTAEAGMLTAGIFLKKFVGETPWAHIDIAGPAYIDKAWGYNTAGATGVMLRTLLEYIEQ